ncbi:cytochrome c biogenesis CcdA family protein [Corynebacterium cystitidis]|uniref:cytochrome c biogenesis CcdA family protein n=1 Tax=Corynebacterium cystitidis TaxID=35757 RepID=UPI00211E246A|nr:cytochrome c biogenesis CcdA family protein [Corynebacterium cystitidis]
MLSVGLFGAFLAGVLSLISPCSALLVPAFFAYAFASTRQLLGKTLVFFLGLAVVLVPIGTGLGGLGALALNHRDTLITVGGVVMILLGIYAFFGGGFRLPGAAGMQARLSGAGTLGIFALGAVYGFAGFCAGPLLGAVLTTAAVSGSAFYGAAIMAVYALGMAVPLFVLAALWDRCDVGNQAWLRGREVRFGPVRTNSVQMISGAMFVVVGLIFLLTHGTGALSSWLDAGTRNSIELWALDVAGSVNDGLVWLLLGVLAVVGVVWWGSKRASKSGR